MRRHMHAHTHTLIHVERQSLIIPLWPVDRDTLLFLCVCVCASASACVYSHFPHSAFLSCRVAIVLHPRRSADWLPLPLSCRSCHLPRWRPHTHVINSFSSGWPKIQEVSPGGLLHGKATSASTRHTLAWIPHCPPADKGASMELRGGEITQYVAIITPTRGEADRICVGMSTCLYFKRLCLLVEWWVTNKYVVS